MRKKGWMPLGFINVLPASDWEHAEISPEPGDPPTSHEPHPIAPGPDEFPTDGCE